MMCTGATAVLAVQQVLAHLEMKSLNFWNDGLSDVLGYLSSCLVHRDFLAVFSHSHCEQSLPIVSGHVQTYLQVQHHEQ